MSENISIKFLGNVWIPVIIRGWGLDTLFIQFKKDQIINGIWNKQHDHVRVPFNDQIYNGLYRKYAIKEDNSQASLLQYIGFDIQMYYEEIDNARITLQNGFVVDHPPNIGHGNPNAPDAQTEMERSGHNAMGGKFRKSENRRKSGNRRKSRKSGNRRKSRKSGNRKKSRKSRNHRNFSKKR
jgi:hypothetical protein